MDQVHSQRPWSHSLEPLPAVHLGSGSCRLSTVGSPAGLGSTGFGLICSVAPILLPSFFWWLPTEMVQAPKKGSNSLFFPGSLNICVEVRMFATEFCWPVKQCIRRDGSGSPQPGPPSSCFHSNMGSPQMVPFLLAFFSTSSHVKNRFEKHHQYVSWINRCSTDPKPGPESASD